MAELHELLGLDLDDPEVKAALEDSNAFADLIDCLVSAREKLGLTQTQVAERMSTTQSAVSDFERVGGDPQVSTIQRYARAVGGRLRMMADILPAPDAAPAAARAAICSHGCDVTRCSCLACEAEQPDEAAPAATDLAGLREQYANAIRRAPFRELRWKLGEPQIITANVDDLADAVLNVRDREMGQLRARAERAEAELRRYTEAESADAAAGSYAGRAETAEQHRDQLQRAIDDVRRFNQLTADASCRVQAAEHARDTLQILDASLNQTQEQP